MTASKDQDTIKNKAVLQYELLPPDGGWGHVITIGLALMIMCSAQPMFAFGIVYEDFLRDVSDVTTGSTLTNGIFNTVFSFMGLATNSLLQKYSYRKVGLLGAGIFFIGTSATIFVTSLTQLIISFGIVQGIGFGLMLPSAYSAINSYFDKKLNLMMGVSQAAMTASAMVYPSIAKICMEEYGFRGTLLLIAGLSLNCVAGAFTLQPIEWHFLKKPVFFRKNSQLTDKSRTNSMCDEVLLKQMQPLMNEVEKGAVPKYIRQKPRTSIISMGERAMSVTTIDRAGKHKSQENLSTWQSLVQSMDLDIFKDPVYVNISVGLSLSFLGDVLFIAMMASFLSQFSFSKDQVAFMMTVHFGSDLVSRVLVLIQGAVYPIRNRYLVLFGTISSAVLRIVLLFNTSYEWILFMVGALGVCRCFIQTPLPLVLAEAYSDRFSTAFSFFMVVSGVLILVWSLIMSFVKNYTQNDMYVYHLLTLAFGICGVSWIFELVYKKIKGSEKK